MVNLPSFRPDRPFITRTSVFLVTGVLTFPLVAVFVAAASPRLALLQHRSMPALAANHLVTLGLGTMVALGALHHLLPAAAGVREEPRPVVSVQYALHVLGVLMLAAGFLAGSKALLIGGGCAIVLGVSIHLVLAASVLRRRSRWPAALGPIAASLACLGGVAAWGLILALNWRYLFWRDLLGPAGLAVHLALGLVGWFALLIIGVSYFLLPRFAGVQDQSRVRPGLVLVLLLAGVGGIVAGALTWPPLTRAALLAVAAGGLRYAADIRSLLAGWRAARDLTRAHWRVLLAETVLLSVGLAAASLGVLPGEPVRWGVAGVSLFLLGWVTLAITGQAYKVTPFLMWYYRYRLGLTPLEVPRLEAPYWPAAGLPPFALLVVAGPLVSAGVLLARPLVSLTGGLAYLAGACLFSYLLGYSWLPRLWAGRNRPRPAEPR